MDLLSFHTFYHFNSLNAGIIIITIVKTPDNHLNEIRCAKSEMGNISGVVIMLLFGQDQAGIPGVH